MDIFVIFIFRIRQRKFHIIWELAKVFNDPDFSLQDKEFGGSSYDGSKSRTICEFCCNCLIFFSLQNSGA